MTRLEQASGHRQLAAVITDSHRRLGVIPWEVLILIDDMGTSLTWTSINMIDEHSRQILGTKDNYSTLDTCGCIVDLLYK